MFDDYNPVVNPERHRGRESKRELRENVCLGTVMVSDALALL